MSSLIVFPGRDPMWSDAPAILRAALGASEDLRFAYSLDEAASLADDAIEIMAAFVLDGRTVHKAPALRWIQGLGAGVDGFAGLPEIAPSVWLTSLRGLHGPAVAEAAMAALLALARGQGLSWSDQRARRWRPRPARLLNGQVLGIVGVGVIGEALGLRASAFGMRVVGFSEHPRNVENFDEIVPRSHLRERIGDCDAVVLLTPLTDATRRLIDAAMVAAMKPGAVLVNLGRGGLVDQAAVATALDRGALAGAALDVFETEPLADDDPLWTTPNLVITPHSAGRHLGYVAEAAAVFAANLAHWRAGTPERMVNIIRSAPRV